jgi:hypothetical protein
MAPQRAHSATVFHGCVGIWKALKAVSQVLDGHFGLCRCGFHDCVSILNPEGPEALSARCATVEPGMIADLC